MVIVYSGASRDTVTLSVKATEVAQAILRAKALAISTYSVPGQARTCGYGVAFDSSANTFSLVSYELSGGGSCQAGSVNGGDLVGYSSSTWQVPIGPGVSLAPGGVSLVLFYPPDPTTLTSASACTPGGSGCTYGLKQASLSATLRVNDGSASSIVNIGTAGQVDIQ